MKMTTVLQNLEKFAEKEKLNMEDMIEIGKLWDMLYPMAPDSDTFRQGADLVMRLDKLAERSEVRLSDRLSGLYSGYFMAYHDSLKMLPRDEKGVVTKPIPSEIEERIKELEIAVDRGYHLLDKENTPRLWVKYGLLLALIKSQLQFNPDEAKKIDQEIEPMIKEMGEESLTIKLINNRGLEAVAKGEIGKAVHIFGEAKGKFPKAANIPHARQDFAHTLNNRAKYMMEMADNEKDPRKKAKLLRKAIVGLNEALQLYKRVPVSPPMNHILGVRNRLIMAAFKWLSLGSETAGAAKEISELFSAREAEEAVAKIREVQDRYSADTLNSVMKGLGEIEKIIVENKTNM